MPVVALSCRVPDEKVVLAAARAGIEPGRTGGRGETHERRERDAAGGELPPKRAGSPAGSRLVRRSVGVHRQARSVRA